MTITSDTISKEGLHYIHVSINSYLLKIEELGYIAKMTRSVVTWISDFNSYESVFNSRIKIENNDLICFDESRHENGVTYFKNHDLSYNRNSFLPSEMQNVFMDILRR